MQKAKTLAWKANSARNRHNGRVNADTAMILGGKDTKFFQTADDRKYAAAVYVRALEPNPLEPDEQPKMLVKTRIVRVPETMAYGG